MPAETSPISAKIVLIPKSSLGHISRAIELAQASGYEFVLWNDRVYRIENNRQFDTGLTIADVI